jgi:hypothetical protein
VAQQASDRVNAATAKLSSNAPTTSVANVATQVTFSGSLASPGVLGTAGPAPKGGYHFSSGSALENGFNLAMLGKVEWRCCRHRDGIENTSPPAPRASTPTRCLRWRSSRTAACIHSRW